MKLLQDNANRIRRAKRKFYNKDIIVTSYGNMYTTHRDMFRDLNFKNKENNHQTCDGEVYRAFGVGVHLTDRNKTLIALRSVKDKSIEILMNADGIAVKK